MCVGMARKKSKKEEPELLIKPVGRLGGLDNIHVSLVALIAILIAMLLVVSYSKPQVIGAPNATNAANSSSNSSAILQPIHTEQQVLSYASRVLASYNYVKSYSSILPYFSDIRNATAYYIPQTKEWYVSVPAHLPGQNRTAHYSLLVYDSNLTAQTAFSQTPLPSQVLNDQVVADGVIKLYGKYACPASNQTSIFWFIDPYGPGVVTSLENITGIEARYGNRVNITVKILSGYYTNVIANSYGMPNAQELGKYLFCTSKQKNFSVFAQNIESAYGSSYMSGQLLRTIANYSRLNVTELNACISNSTATLNEQALLAQYYNVTSTPIAIVNCEYEALPQTVDSALCYSNPSFCRRP